ncbi:MAG: sel1 repeat family protein [Succinivibrio sp.]|nr:sel1 repeat family protein [Succinivibrio sp.]
MTQEEIQKNLEKINDEYSKKNYSEAFKLCCCVAKLGISEAQNYLGVMYFRGLGVKQDYTEAKNWWLKASEQGFAKAQYNLGDMFYNGEGGKKKFL